MPPAARNQGRTSILSLILFLGAFGLTAYSAKHPATTEISSGLLMTLIGPLQSGSSQLLGLGQNIWSNYVSLRGVRDENKRLHDRLKVLEANNSSLLELEHENKRLKGLLQVSAETALTGVTVNVSGYDPSNYTRTVSLSQGKESGIIPGAAVLDGNGVVGQVIAASDGAARVLLLVDRGSGVDAIVQGSRARGVLVGDGKSACSLKFILTEDTVNVGDRIITSGSDGVFPKGLFLGLVADVEENPDGLFRRIDVKPAVDFGKLETIMVINSLEKKQKPSK